MIEKQYAYHLPSPAGKVKIKQLRERFSDINNLIMETCPPSRERSVALTELETAAMWAIKSVVFNDLDSTVER